MYYMWSLEDKQAVTHVKERIAEDGDHTITGCPRFCRAMCLHRNTILKMVADKKWPNDLTST